MKKILFFALALVAGVMAFTSCNKKETVESPIVGTWMRVAGESDFFYTFGEDGTYQRIEDYYMNGRDVVAHEHIVGDGTFKIDGDVIDATLNSILVYMDGSKDGDPFDEFWPMNEKLKFSLKGDYLTLIHNAGTEEEWPELLLKQCNGNDPEDKDAVIFNAKGELRGVMFDIHNTEQEAVVTLHPRTNTVDVKFVQARIESESETPKDIFIYGMPVSTEDGNFSHIKLVLEDGSPYTPFPKSYAYAVMNSGQTMFNIHFGNDNESDTQVYLVFNALLTKVVK